MRCTKQTAAAVVAHLSGHPARAVSAAGREAAWARCGLCVCLCVLSTLLPPLQPPAASLHLLTVSCLHSDLTQNAPDSSRIVAFQCNPCSVPKGFAEARSNQYYINTSANRLLTVNTVIVLKTMELTIFSGL